jgi:hypothetical protein
MTLEQLQAELADITDEKTEAVMLIVISPDEIRARAFGCKDLVKAALEDLLDDYDNVMPTPEIYAH